MKRNVITSLIVLTAILSHLQPLTAQPLAPANAVPKEHVDTAASERAQLAQALFDLEQMFAVSPPEHTAGWKAYLNWDELVKAAQSPSPESESILRSARWRFFRNHPGLEMSRFRTVRDRIGSLLDASLKVRENAASDAIQKSLTELNERTARYGATLSGTDGVELARILGRLRRQGVDAPSIANMQSPYSLPNFYGEASSQLFASRFSRAVDQVAPVHDNILGTSINGTSHTTGYTSLSLQPSGNSAMLVIRLQAVARSNTTGVNGPVTVCSTGSTNICASKPIVIDEHGVRTLPASAQCQTSTTINGIGAKRKIVERIAWKRAGEQKSQAEAIASQRAESRVAAELNRETDAQLSEANRAYWDRFRTPLIRLGLDPQLLQFNTGSDSLGVQMLERGPNQIGASTTPISLSRAHSATNRVHETFVTNVSTQLLGGFELTDENAQKFAKDATGEVPDELKITEETEPWGITFADEAPITAVFHGGNRVRVGIRLQRIARGRDDEGKPETDLRTLVELSAVYEITLTPNGSIARRVGDIEVEYVELKKLTAAQVTVKAFLKRKFGSVFKQEVVSSGIDLAKVAKQGNVQGRLVMREFQTDRGWLATGWEYQR